MSGVGEIKRYLDAMRRGKSAGIPSQQGVRAPPYRRIEYRDVAATGQQQFRNRATSVRSRILELISMVYDM
jgi:hypothetical protein